MELPVHQPNDTASPPALLRAVHRGEVIMARTYAEEAPLDAATAYTAPDFPDFGSGNFAIDLQPADDGPRAAEGLLDAIDQHFTDHQTCCHVLLCNQPTWPPALRRSALARGFDPQPLQVLELTAYQRPAKLNAVLQIIPARAAVAQLRDLLGGPKSTWARAAVAQLDEPRLDMLLARLDGQPVGAAGVLTLGQIGLITDVYAATSARRRGVGKALLASLIDLCSRAQFEKVILSHDPGCGPATQFYTGLGFTPALDYEVLLRTPPCDGDAMAADESQP